MKEQDIYQLIDSYLNDELNSEDKLNVESRIQNEPEFAETFSMLEKVYGKVEDKGAMDLIHRMHEMNEKYPVSEIDLTVEEAASSPKKETVNVQMSEDIRSPKGTNNVMKWLFPILLIGGALLVYFMNKNSAIVPHEEDPKKEIPSSTPEIKTTPQEKKPIEEKVTPPVKEEKAPEKKVEPKQEENPKPKLYAAVDFEPNPMLDKMIGTTTRSELSFEVNSPTLNQNFSESTSSVSFTGKTTSSEGQSGTFRLLNNKRLDISEQKFNSTDSFNFSTKIPKPGLYYYTIKLGSKTYVGKFTVGKKN